MSNSMRVVARTLLSAAIIAAHLAIAVAALAEEEPGPASISPPDREAPQIEHFDYWRARADAARARVASTEAELAEANAAVSRMRRNNHPRGDARVEIREEQTRARAAHEESMHYLEVELPREARAAGAEQSWLRERR